MPRFVFSPQGYDITLDTGAPDKRYIRLVIKEGAMYGGTMITLIREQIKSARMRRIISTSTAHTFELTGINPDDVLDLEPLTNEFKRTITRKDYTVSPDDVRMFEKTPKWKRVLYSYRDPRRCWITLSRLEMS